MDENENVLVQDHLQNPSVRPLRRAQAHIDRPPDFSLGRCPVHSFHFPKASPSVVRSSDSASADDLSDRQSELQKSKNRVKPMGFVVTSLIFTVIGILGSLCTRVFCNSGPSTNLFLITLVITATVCCWMMWAIVYLAQMKPLIVPILTDGE